jgi:predicted site-specific integrase-resolvase
MPDHSTPTVPAADLIGSADAEIILGIDRATVTRWAASGRLKLVTRLPGIRGALLFDRTQVCAVAEEIKSGKTNEEKSA